MPRGVITILAPPWSKYTLSLGQMPFTEFSPDARSTLYRSRMSVPNHACSCARLNFSVGVSSPFSGVNSSGLRCTALTISNPCRGQSAPVVPSQLPVKWKRVWPYLQTQNTVNAAIVQYALQEHVPQVPISPHPIKTRALHRHPNPIRSSACRPH